MGEVSDKKVAVLGLAFKPETDDMREAPSVDIIRGLIELGAQVYAYDPVAMGEAAKILPQIEFAEDEYAAVKGANALIFLTEWNQFRRLDMDRLKQLMREPNIIDLRNLYEPETMRSAGFKYLAMGRS